MSHKAPIHKLLKKVWLGVAVLIIFAALCSSVFRSLTPLATHYKKDVEHHLTQLLGEPVSIHSMQTGWYWFHPVLQLNHITIHGKPDAIHIKKLFVGVNLFKSLIHWRIQPGLLYIDTIHLVARKKGTQWAVDGLSINPQVHYAFVEHTQHLIAILAPQERLLIKHASIDLFTDNRHFIPIKNLNFSIVNHGMNYKIKGTASVAAEKNAQFELLANLNFNPLNYRQTQGHIYCSLHNVLLDQWQKVLPQSDQVVTKGKGSLSLWIDLDQGTISSAQARLSLNDVAWHNLNTKKIRSIPKFYANMSWKPEKQGWQFQADHINLHLGAVEWPENQILVRFNKTQHSYSLFAKSIIIQSLLTVIDYWPELADLTAEMKPQGILNDLQLVVKDKKPNYLLTRFEQLSWHAQQHLPGVSHLSGALQWAPQEGHLELDSKDTSLYIKGYPQQNLDLLNASIDWKELSNGFRLSIEHFVLSQPELTLSAQGGLDGVSNDSLGSIRLGVDFSAKNVQKWMPYLPKKHMKIKLFNWLNNDIKRIEQVTGTLKLNGLISDFPFDQGNGDFSITAHAVGGELLITPKWPVIKDLEGYIRLKKRSLDIDIIDGDAQGVPLKQINLRIDEIGRDKETLLLHGFVRGTAQKMLDFILASPLKDKLSKLKMFAMQGILSTDFKLEIPLYPENDENLAEGRVVFANNLMTIKHHLGVLPIEDINGTLAFNESGVKDSHLTATAFDYPLNINLYSVKKPAATTFIAVNGTCTMEWIKNKFSAPVFSLFKGMFAIDALLKISADPKHFDSLTFNSTLEGLAINTPEPLGKKYDEQAPLSLTLEFKSEQEVRIKTDYNHKLSSDIVLEQNNNNAFELTSGQISFGDRQALDQKIPGLDIVGILDGFNFEQWNKLYSQFSRDDTQSFILKKLRSFNVQLHQLQFLKQQFTNCFIKGTIQPNQDWFFTIKQKKISADLTYDSTKKLLSGFVHYLHLDKIKAIKDEGSITKIQPNDIPNLNLRIDDVTLGEIKIGNIILKSHSNEKKWAIDYCRIDSPAYQWTIGGSWLQKNNTNQTNTQIRLHFNDLAQSLKYWNVTPAVHANQGDLTFSGGWPAPIFDFSLAALKGTMSLQLNNGQITHLSPETEEKLGLGKLLSILSLQTIPRRLKLDFSDLSNQGYSFDIFKGDFNVAKGIINTENSYIDGPVAYASMNGTLDIIKHTYDLHLSVSPHITASLPVVATIAGGPIAGLAAWVANKIINQSMQKITGYSYKISGPWDDPVVQQLSINKQIIKK